MESQINKSRLLNDIKEDNERKKRIIAKKEPIKITKDLPEENDVIIISKFL